MQCNFQYFMLWLTYVFQLLTIMWLTYVFLLIIIINPINSYTRSSLLLFKFVAISSIEVSLYYSVVRRTFNYCIYSVEYRSTVVQLSRVFAGRRQMEVEES